MEHRLQITVHRGLAGQAQISLPCSPDRVARIKTLPERHWNARTRSWVVPDAPGLVHELRRLFPHDTVIETTRLTPDQLAESWRESLARELRLRGYRARTRKAYTGHVRRLVEHFGKPPLQISEAELRAYLTRLLDEGRSHGYLNQCISAVKFLYHRALSVDRNLERIPRPKKEHKLPRVLSASEVVRILTAVSNVKHRAILLLTYSAGLRVGEVVRLRHEDIDTDRRMIHIRQGKRRKDRYTMLSEVALEALRVYLETYRTTTWLFPGGKPGKHLHERSVQKVFERACRKAGIRKSVTVHTLRHSFATHLLEQGTDLRYIQELLGHASSRTTEIYTRVSRRSIANIRSPLDTIAGVDPEQEHL